MLFCGASAAADVDSSLWIYYVPIGTLCRLSTLDSADVDADDEFWPVLDADVDNNIGYFTMWMLIFLFSI